MANYLVDPKTGTVGEATKAAMNVGDKVYSGGGVYVKQADGSFVKEAGSQSTGNWNDVVNSYNAANNTPSTTNSGGGGNANYYSTGGTPGTVDYSKLINDAILTGKDADTVRGLVEQRGAKIDADPSLEQYRNDDTYKRALDYIAAQERQNNSLAEMEKQLKSLYAQNGALDQAAEAERQAKIEAVEAAIGRLNTQKDDLNDSYNALQRQLYINREKNAKNIQQQMAAAGLTGGAAESTLLGLSTAYEEGLRQGEQERAKAIGEIEQGITDTQLTGNLDAAETLCNRTKENLDSYAQALQILMQQENARQQQEKEDRVAAQNRAYTLALSMLEGGVMPSSDMLTTAGLDMGTAQQLKAAADALKTVPTYQGTPKTQKPSETQFEIAMNAALNGSTDASVRQIIESYSGLPMETALAAYGYAGSIPTTNPLAAGNGPVALDTGTTGTGAKTQDDVLGAWKTMQESPDANIVTSQVRLALQMGNTDLAKQVLDQKWSKMTQAERNVISAMLAQYGIEYVE